MKAKRIIAIAIIGLFVNACAHNKIRFGPRHNTDRIEQRVNIPPKEEEQHGSNLETSISSDEKELQVIDNIEQGTESADSKILQSRDKRIEKMQDKIFSMTPEESENPLTERNADNGTAEKGVGLGLVLGGLLLLGIAILTFFYGANKSDNGTPDGCVSMLFLFGIAALLGIGGLVLLIVGIVLASVGGAKSHRQVKTDTGSEDTRSEQTDEEEKVIETEETNHSDPPKEMTKSDQSGGYIFMGVVIAAIVLWIIASK